MVDERKGATARSDERDMILSVLLLLLLLLLLLVDGPMVDSTEKFRRNNNHSSEQNCPLRSCCYLCISGNKKMHTRSKPKLTRQKKGELKDYRGNRSASSGSNLSPKQ